MSMPLLVLALTLALGCGGRSVEDAGSGGFGGSLHGGGGPGTGGVGNSCDFEAVECEGSYCSCEGVFGSCHFGDVRCEMDPNGDPTTCACGVPEIANGACDYLFQHRCAPPDAHLWVRKCTCDPALPTDDEPCRYFQQMYDDLGEERSCFLAVVDVEPLEKYKYYCSCPESG